MCTISQQRIVEASTVKLRRPEAQEPAKACPDGAEATALGSLLQQVGNRAIQRLLAQRSGDGPFELDEAIEARINQERGGGQPLDSTVQAKMSAATGHDLSGVRAHTGPESHALNEQLSARAFTTGQDIFFREGAYEPGSSGGQELLAHELTHVVQQSTGVVGGGGSRMTVNAPGDAFEQEAEAVSKAVTSGAATEVQREVLPEDEGEIQKQALEDEEETLQMQTMPEDELEEEEQA